MKLIILMILIYPLLIIAKDNKQYTHGIFIGGSYGALHYDQTDIATRYVDLFAGDIGYYWGTPQERLSFFLRDELVRLAFEHEGRDQERTSIGVFSDFSIYFLYTKRFLLLSLEGGIKGMVTRTIPGEIGGVVRLGLGYYGKYFSFNAICAEYFIGLSGRGYWGGSILSVTANFPLY